MKKVEYWHRRYFKIRDKTYEELRKLMINNFRNWDELFTAFLEFTIYQEFYKTLPKKNWKYKGDKK